VPVKDGGGGHQLQARQEHGQAIFSAAT